MSMWRKTILATALVGAGLASTTGAAFAGQSEGSHGHESAHEGTGARGESCENDVKADNGDGDTTQTGVINVDDLQTIVPINACGNNVPVNVLGVQVPIQDSSFNVPVLSGTEDGTNSAVTG